MKRLFALFLLLAAMPVHATLNVLACEPEWDALVRELGGDKVRSVSATTGLQDPHRVEARPSIIARARSADLLVCTGAELETGWLPVLLQSAANPKIQPGQAGHFEVADFVVLMEKPARLDRSEGDVHGAGNPHFQTDPRRIARVAEALAKRLADIDPANANFYATRHKVFAEKWSAAISRWEKQAAPLKGVPAVVQHKDFSYLFDWLGLKEVAVLEPKPGVEPSSAHLTGVLARLQKEPARLILRAAYQGGRPSEWLEERAKLPVVVVPFTVGGSEAAKDLFSLFDDTVARLLAVLK